MRWACDHLLIHGAVPEVLIPIDDTHDVLCIVLVAVIGQEPHGSQIEADDLVAHASRQSQCPVQTGKFNKQGHRSSDTARASLCHH